MRIGIDIIDDNYEGRYIYFHDLKQCKDGYNKFFSYKTLKIELLPSGEIHIVMRYIPDDNIDGDISTCRVMNDEQNKFRYNAEG